MNLTRKLKRRRVSRGLTFEAYCKLLIEKLPNITVNGEPMNHSVGIEAAIFQASNESKAIELVAAYADRVIQLYHKILRDKEEFNAKEGIKEITQ